MSGDQENENAELLAPYLVARNDAAHQCLQAMLDGRHEDAGRLLQEYQLAALAVESMYQLLQAWDDGNITFDGSIVEIRVDPPETAD
jgi:hypothetical protein